MNAADLTATELREALIYEPDTGVFRRRVRAGRETIGTIAGSVGKNGYRYIAIKRRKYLAHRLAWLYMRGEWPIGDIDHKNLDRADNRDTELRSATRMQNMQNIRRHRDNRSGFKGVSWDRQRKLWRATIQISGKWQQLGRFQSAASAHGVYVAAARRHFGEFARTT